MDSFKSRSMRGAILAGLAGLTLAGFGCEKQDGPAAWNAQQEANAERPRGAKAITTIKAKLDGIASDKGTGESVLAHATIADAEVLAASEPALDFRKSLDRSRQLAATIEDRAASAQRLLNAAASINARNPEQSITAIDGFKAAGNGDGNAATFTLGDNSLPSINALNQNISKLTSEIATREAEIAKLTDQRAKLLEKADKADRKSGTVERDERVKVVQQAADARNDAAKISSQIDGLNAQLLHLRADQKAEQAQLAALQEGIGWLDEQSAGLGAAWTEMNQHATGLTSKANTLLSTGESSVTELTAALEKEIAEADALLKQADEHFDLAVKSYNDAAGVAGTLASNFGTASEEGQTSSFKTLVEAFPRGRYDVNAAWTNLTRAKLHADYAAALADRKAVATSLANAAKASGYKVPDALNPDAIDKTLRAEITAADAYFQEAHNKLEDVAGSARTPSLKNAAIGGRIFNNYYRSVLSDLAGKIGGFDEIAGKGPGYVLAAKNALNDATEAKLPTPFLPASLRVIEKPTEEAGGIFGGDGSSATEGAEGAVDATTPEGESSTTVPSTTNPSETTEETPAVDPATLEVAAPTDGTMDGDRADFGTFSIQVPANWTKIGVGDMQALAEFPDAKPFAALARNWRANIGDANFTMAVLNTPVTDAVATAKTYATASASEFMDETLLVDGETGYKMKSNDPRTFNPMPAVFVVHNNSAYIIAGGRVNGDDAWADLEEIIKGWKWAEVEAEAAPAE